MEVRKVEEKQIVQIPNAQTVVRYEFPIYEKRLVKGMEGLQDVEHRAERYTRAQLVSQLEKIQEKIDAIDALETK